MHAEGRRAHLLLKALLCGPRRDLVLEGVKMCQEACTFLTYNRDMLKNDVTLAAPADLQNMHPGSLQLCICMSFGFTTKATAKREIKLLQNLVVEVGTGLPSVAELMLIHSLM